MQNCTDLSSVVKVDTELLDEREEDVLGERTSGRVEHLGGVDQFTSVDHDGEVAAGQRRLEGLIKPSLLDELLELLLCGEAGLLVLLARLLQCRQAGHLLSHDLTHL